MIGMLNVPCESPTEYYAAPNSKPQTSKNDELPSWQRKSSKRISVFTKRRLNHQVNYLKDGRKIRDGQLVDKQPAPKLWEKLLLRSLAHKIEDEIESPVTEAKELVLLPKSSRSPEPQTHHRHAGKQCTNSTWSLVSAQNPAGQAEPDRPRSRSCTTAAPSPPKAEACSHFF